LFFCIFALKKLNTPMLRRKIEEQFVKWKKTANRKPLIVRGVRQCGKTFSVMAFAESNYENVVYINFVKQEAIKLAFKNAKDVDSILLNLSAAMRGVKFVPGKTCIILDEIQDCKDARTALKFFKMDGRFDIIGTGSLLGVKGYGDEKKKKEGETSASVPVGYEKIIDMYPLDFEEFLWANGISESIIDEIKKHFNEETPVPDGIHTPMNDLFRKYAVVGGMPEVVNTFLETNNIGDVYEVQRNIVEEYKDDMIKYSADEDKARIRECFESIPRQLAKDNKKFQYSVVKKGGRSSEYISCLQWIEDAGIIKRCYNTHITELPLDGNAITDNFKVYMGDMGLFVSMLEYGTQADILRGNLLGYKGAIFENLSADIFTKMGRNLYYFHKDSGLEVDFLMRYKGECTLVEVKATTGNAKSTKTILKNHDVYHVDSAIKLGDYNVGRNDNLLTIPFYMAFLLNEP